MKMMRKVVLVAILVMVLLSNACVATAQTTVPIAEIKKEVEGGWHKTYEAHGRTITVDIDIDVPDVQAVPIIRTTYPPELEPLDVSSTDSVSVSRDGLVIVKESGNGVFRGDGDKFEIAGNDSRAENSSIDINEAQAILEELFRRYQNQTGLLDLRLYARTATSRMYNREKRDGNISDLNMDKPTTQIGSYYFVYEQFFHGIPSISYGPFFSTVSRKKNVTYAGGSLAGEIATRDDYILQFYPAIEQEIMADDVSLVNFEVIKHALEDLIKAGIVREVRSVRLAYYSFMDSENPEETYILLPIWELRGVLVEKASSPEVPEAEFYPEFDKTYYGQSVFVNAISGEIIGIKKNWEYADLSSFR